MTERNARAVDDWMTQAQPAALLMMMDSTAEKAAEKAVQSTFHLLGVDLEDPEAVRILRDSFTEVRNRFESRRRRSENFQKGLIHGIVMLAVTAIIGAWGYVHK